MPPSTRSIAQDQCVAACEPRLMVQAMENASNVNGYVKHLTVRITEVVDRLIGGEPKDAKNSCGAPSPSGELPQLLDLIRSANYGLGQIESQLDRLNRI